MTAHPSDDEDDARDRLTLIEVQAHAKRFAELEKENALLIGLVRDLIERVMLVETRLAALEKPAAL